MDGMFIVFVVFMSKLLGFNKSTEKRLILLALAIIFIS